MEITQTAKTDDIAKRELQVVRFTRLNRTLHVFMIVSFISLALTGMSLKFSYTGWAVFLSRLFGGFESAGYIHRFAAVVMVSVFIIHLVDLIRMRKKEALTWKELILGENSLLFNKKDLRDFHIRKSEVSSLTTSFLPVPFMVE